MILINGADGIGSGWSSTIPNHNPRHVIDNLRRLISGEEILPISPYFQGFTGEITKDVENEGTYLVKGNIERADDTKIVITELPIRCWTQSYKELLEKMMIGCEKHPAIIQDFKENHTETEVHFTITALKEKIDEWEQQPGGLPKQFKLNGTLKTTNMVGFYERKLTKFQSTRDILRVFFNVRHVFYIKRKTLLVRKLKADQLKLSNKARFVEEVCTGQLVISNRKKVDTLGDLKMRGYDSFIEKSDGVGSSVTVESDSIEKDPSVADLAKGFDYLLGMKLWSLTSENAEALRAERDKKKTELDTLEGTSPEQIWLNDLAAIELALDSREAAMASAVTEEKEARAKSKQNQVTQKKLTKKRKSKSGEVGEDDEEGTLNWKNPKIRV